MRSILSSYFQDFFSYVILSLKRTFQFSGRASCAEFWSFQFFFYCVSASLALLECYFSPSTESFSLGAVLSFLLLVPLVVTNISVSCRRLHDRNLSGWRQLLYLLCVTLVLTGGAVLLLLISYKFGWPSFEALTSNKISSNPYWILAQNIVTLVFMVIFFAPKGDQQANRFGDVPDTVLDAKGKANF